MIDRKAGGHLLEFELLKESECILAVLRLEGHGSTSMMHADTSHPNIRFFDFKDTPYQAIGEAVEWAETFARDKGKEYDGLYPWRLK